MSRVPCSDSGSASGSGAGGPWEFCDWTKAKDNLAIDGRCSGGFRWGLGGEAICCKPTRDNNNSNLERERHREKHRIDDYKKKSQINEFPKFKKKPCFSTASLPGCIAVFDYCRSRRSTLPTRVSPESPPVWGPFLQRRPGGLRAKSNLPLFPCRPASLQKKKAIQLAPAAFGLHWLAALADRAPAQHSAVHRLASTIHQPSNQTLPDSFQAPLRFPRAADHNTHTPCWPMRGRVIIFADSCIPCPLVSGRVWQVWLAVAELRQQNLVRLTCSSTLLLRSISDEGTGKSCMGMDARDTTIWEHFRVIQDRVRTQKQACVLSSSSACTICPGINGLASLHRRRQQAVCLSPTSQLIHPTHTPPVSSNATCPAIPDEMCGVWVLFWGSGGDDDGNEQPGPLPLPAPGQAGGHRPHFPHSAGRCRFADWMQEMASPGRIG